MDAKERCCFPEGRLEPGCCQRFYTVEELAEENDDLHGRLVRALKCLTNLAPVCDQLGADGTCKGNGIAVWHFEDYDGWDERYCDPCLQGMEKGHFAYLRRKSFYLEDDWVEVSQLMDEPWAKEILGMKEKSDAPERME